MAQVLVTLYLSEFKNTNNKNAHLRIVKKSSSLKFQKAVAIAMAFLFFCVATAYAVADENKNIKKEVDLYFALSDKHGFPLTERKTSFDCSDKIYAIVDLHNYEKKTYTLSFAWIDPTGKERELTEYPFTVREQTTHLWSWLSLSRARGAGMIQWINPAAGLEEFIGEWTIEIRINQKKVKSGQIEVLC